MQVTDAANPQTVDTVLLILTWFVVIFGGLWLVTGVIGYMHRRAYNLTRAESGRSKNIQPDFLRVDHKKRDAAMKRGAAYDRELERRDEAEAAALKPPVDRLHAWSKAAATVSAAFTLLTAVIGTLTKVDSMQAGAQQLGSWDSLVDTMNRHPIGSSVAIIVIIANVIVFIKAAKKASASA